MPEGVSLAKQMATQAYGGEVILFGQNTDEALGYAKKLAEGGKCLIHPFDDEQVIAGQGTIGLEILEEVPGVEAIIVPMGGGGLISGIATIVKKRKPKVKIIGVQSAHVPSAYLFFKEKKDCGGEGEADISRWDCHPKGGRDHLSYDSEGSG